jgi:tetratricopeptide (TPR) repeat protein
MHYFNRFILVFLIMAISALSAHSAFAEDSSKNRIDYWVNNFDELTPQDDSYAKRAHIIFGRVLNAAGSRPGVLPRLFIVKTESNYIPLAFAIPDGTIIISKKVLDLCYRDSQRGDDRLAFLLGHEIAHQLKDDFWHQRFFQAVTLSKSKSPSNKEILDEVLQAAKMTDKVLAKEIQADEHGIIYAAMAGFNTDAIITEDDQVNFFEYVAQAMDPDNIKGFRKDPTHPSPKQRANTIKVRLKQVLDKVALYDLGLLFYEAGDYGRAILFFGEFLRFFPSREVYHNLATCHHQIALKHYRVWKKEDETIPFKLSLTIDPTTRAKQITLRGTGNPESLFNDQIEMAIKYYRAAIDQDPAYRLAYNNFGCALIAKGEVYKAIGVFKDALKLDSEAKTTLNNLGVVFYLIENPAKAMELLTAASRIDPNYSAPYFNMGKIAYTSKSTSKAKKYWMAYLEIDAYSPWADMIRAALSLKKAIPKVSKISIKEKSMKLEIGAYEDDIPPEWGKPIRTNSYHLKEEPFKVMQYANGFLIICQDDEIIVISATLSCKGNTSKGIANGDDFEKVAKTYGLPQAEIELSNGKSWIYPAEGITFNFQDQQVSSWTMF